MPPSARGVSLVGGRFRAGQSPAAHVFAALAEDWSGHLLEADENLNFFLDRKACQPGAPAPLGSEDFG